MIPNLVLAAWAQLAVQPIPTSAAELGVPNHERLAFGAFDFVVLFVGWSGKTTSPFTGAI